MRAWSRIAVGRLRPAVEALDDVVTFRDEAGRILYDLAGAPRPDASVDAPPRLLPMWDSILLGHADRTRILPGALHRAVIATNGDVVPTFTVDGDVAGVWWAEDATGPDREPTTRIVLEGADQLSRDGRRALDAEAMSLAKFVAPREPALYARFRERRGRQPADR